jgi:hypothetical protein
MVPRSHHRNFSLHFQVNLLESKLGLRGIMAMIYAVSFSALVLIRADLLGSEG